MKVVAIHVGTRAVHPGVILRDDFMAPLALSANALARAMNVPLNRVTMLLREERDITADTALRLARAFDNKPEYWMNLQVEYDLRKVEAKSGAKIAIEVQRVR